MIGKIPEWIPDSRPLASLEPASGMTRGCGAHHFFFAFLGFSAFDFSAAFEAGFFDASLARRFV